MKVMKDERHFDKDFFAKAGSRGGKTTAKRYGKNHYKKISKLGIAKRWGKK